MKRKNLFTVLGFAVPLVLVALLILLWRLPLRRTDGWEMRYFLLAVVLAYPALSVFCGIAGVVSGFSGKWLAVPFTALLGVVLALGLHFPVSNGLIFGFWGAVVALIALRMAAMMRREGRW